MYAFSDSDAMMSLSQEIESRHREKNSLVLNVIVTLRRISTCTGIYEMHMVKIVVHSVVHTAVSSLRIEALCVVICSTFMMSELNQCRKIHTSKHLQLVFMQRYILPLATF
jgi:hypothetical protein